MALKITLRPNERMIISGAVVTNGSAKCSLAIENNVPLLREKEILKEDEADSPGRRIYFIVQFMYIDEENLATYHNAYWKLVDEFLLAAPSALGLIDLISEHILAGRYYQALKLTKKLIYYEQEVLKKCIPNQ